MKKKDLINRLPLKIFFILLLALGLFAGLINVFPHSLIKKEIERQGNLYLPIQTDGMFSDEAIWYIPMSKKIFENHGARNDFFFEQYINTPTPIPMLPSYMYAILFLFSGNISQIFLVGIFLFSFISFFIFYFSGRIFFSSRSRALFFACFTVVASFPIRNFSYLSLSMLDSAITFITSGSLVSFYVNISYFLSTFSAFILPISSFLPVNFSMISLTDPLITYLIYIPAIASLLHFFIKPSNKSAIISGILIGLLFQSYLYYAVLLSVIALTYLFYAFFYYERKDLNRIFILIGIISFFFLFYAFDLYRFYQLPQAGEIGRRLGAEHGFGFRWIVWKEYVVYAAFFILNRFIFKNTQHKKYLFYSLAFLSMFICYNLQMIFGFMPHPDHWGRTFSPLLFIFFMDVIFSWPYFHKTFRRRFVLELAVLICVLLIFFTSVVNFFRFKHPDKETFAVEMEQFTFDKDIFDSYEWINRHPGKYISPSFLTTYYLVLYTQSSPYLASAANSLASNYELEQRFLETLKIWNVSSSQLEIILSDPRNKNKSSFNSSISLNLYTNYYQEQSFNYSLKPGSGRIIPDEKIKELLKRYDMIKIDPNDYKGYYLYYGPFEKDVVGDFAGEIQLEKVYSNEKVVIYKII